MAVYADPGRVPGVLKSPAEWTCPGCGLGMGIPEALVCTGCAGYRLDRDEAVSCAPPAPPAPPVRDELPAVKPKAPAIPEDDE